ncbi:MAG: DUF1343 domain-containing protein, partial [Simkaniaceae bacterium]|nr:DUF1343 domain-containing protein [Simkaniaceae bacterium]
MKLVLFFLIISDVIFAKIDLGIDQLFSPEYEMKVKNKRVALVTNHTGVSKDLILTSALFQKKTNLVALFSPEHGLDGVSYAFEKVKDGKGSSGIPIYSLHGKTRRPTEEMLQGIDVIVYDMQDIGVRGYTYATTLFYVMEEASKKKMEVIVLDRPNPMGGKMVDGAMLDSKWRSYIGYINVPYCHGMTIGELAHFFNEEYKIGCNLTVVPMKGWKRSMKYSETGLAWIPPSPHIPEADTPFYNATTGILGELDLVNIGIGYTLPFKVVGATWIDADKFAEKLNEQHLSGVHFIPFHYRPFYGSYKGKNCHGVLINITDFEQYKPLGTQCLILGILNTLYPTDVKSTL